MTAAKRWAAYASKTGEFHVGIPARDLTEEDRDALTEAEQRLVEASPLYKVADAKKSEREEAKE